MQFRVVKARPRDGSGIIGNCHTRLLCEIGSAVPFYAGACVGTSRGLIRFSYYLVRRQPSSLTMSAPATELGEPTSGGVFGHVCRCFVSWDRRTEMMAFSAFMRLPRSSFDDMSSARELVQFRSPTTFSWKAVTRGKLHLFRVSPLSGASSSTSSSDF